MFNCYKLFRNSRLFGIFPSEDSALTISYKVDPAQSDDWRIEGAHIPGVGF